MKQKTATFEIYTPYGTSSPNRHLDIRYRGKLLAEVSGQNEANMIAQACRFAHELGYNKTRIRYIVGG